MYRSSAAPPNANQVEIVLGPLHSGRQVYVPGDVLKGEIIIRNPWHAAGLEASISVTAVTRVRFKETGRFLSPEQTHEQLLMNWDKGDLARNKHADCVSWPFAFSIPSNVQSTPSDRFMKSEDGYFSALPGHLLPPSLSGALKAGFVRMIGGESPDKNTTIAYTLHANLIKPYFTHSYPGPTTIRQDVQFSPLRQDGPHHPDLQTISSDHSITPYKPSTDVLENDGVHTHNLFWNTMDPPIRLQTELPGTLIAGQTCSISIRFDHNIPRSAAEKLPPMILRTVAVKVVAITRARAPGTLRREPQASWEHPVLSHQLDVSDMTGSERSIPLTDCRTQYWDLNTLIPTLNTRTLDVPPTFKTFNIARSYILRVEGEFEIDSQKIPFKASRTLLVLPRYNKREASQSSTALIDPSALPQAAADHTEREDDAPPPYCLHERPPPPPPAPPSDAEETELPGYHDALQEKS